MQPQQQSFLSFLKKKCRNEIWPEVHCGSKQNPNNVHLNETEKNTIYSFLRFNNERCIQCQRSRSLFGAVFAELRYGFMEAHCMSGYFRFAYFDHFEQPKQAYNQLLSIFNKNILMRFCFALSLYKRKRDDKMLPQELRTFDRSIWPHFSAISTLTVSNHEQHPFPLVAWGR